MVKFDKSVIAGSFILLITINLYNALNFVFQFGMARLLSIEDYAILAALLSFGYLLGIVTESIQTIITKYSSVEGTPGKLKNILKRSYRKSIYVSTIIFVAYLLLAIPLSPLLKITYPLIALNGLVIFTSFMLPITRGVMQGRKKFYSLGFNLIAESVIKLVLAVVLVIIGWRVYGPIVGLVLGTSFSLLLSFLPLSKIIKSKEESYNTEGIYNYSTPVFVIIFTILAFYSIDIIIAKILFSSTIAGEYAIASILSKTIFWGTQPISKALFPISSEKTKAEETDKEKRNRYLSALGIMCVLIAIALVVISFFSHFLIFLFSGKEIPGSSAVMIYLSVAMSFISLTNLNLLYRLSHSKIKNAYIFIVFLVIEIALFFIFSKDITQFSISFVVSSIIFFLGSLFFLKRNS